jgi:predicted nucleotidyltransferase
MKAQRHSPEIISEFRLLAQEAVKLAPSVLAIYVIGSLARSTHNTPTSDVDVLVATEDACPCADLRRFADLLAESSLPIDAIVLRRSILRRVVFPTPVEVMIKPTGTVVWPDSPRRDAILAIQEATECGLWVCGSEPDYEIPSVPWDLLRRNINYLLPYLSTHFKNPSLSLCRAAYSYRNHRLCSKIEAGTWALSEMRPRFHEMIASDLSSYRTGSHYECPDDLLSGMEHDIEQIRDC